MGKLRRRSLDSCITTSELGNAAVAASLHRKVLCPKYVGSFLIFACVSGTDVSVAPRRESACDHGGAAPYRLRVSGASRGGGCWVSAGPCSRVSPYGRSAGSCSLRWFAPHCSVRLKWRVSRRSSWRRRNTFRKLWQLGLPRLCLILSRSFWRALRLLWN